MPNYPGTVLPPPRSARPTFCKPAVFFFNSFFSLGGATICLPKKFCSLTSCHYAVTTLGNCLECVFVEEGDFFFFLDLVKEDRPGSLGLEVEE